MKLSGTTQNLFLRVNKYKSNDISTFYQYQITLIEYHYIYNVCKFYKNWIFFEDFTEDTYDLMAVQNVLDISCMDKMGPSKGYYAVLWVSLLHSSPKH